MSLYRGSNGGNPKTKVLEKRPPINPRYANIRSKLNTGMTVDKLKFITTRQHLRRQDEAFFRLAPSELSELLIEYEQDRQEGVYDFRDHIDPDHHGPKVMEHAADAVPSYERPYLILDVRDEEEFRRCHVTQARSFEANLLKQDHMTQELYKYKNKDGRLVVLYANDDRKACIAANTLVNKGFNNVFVLSGGLVAFAKGFHSYIEGDMASLKSTAPHCNDRRSGGAGSILGDALTRGSLYGNGCGYEGGPNAIIRRGVSPSRGVSRSGSIGRAPWSEESNHRSNLNRSSKQNGVIPVGGLSMDRRSSTRASAGRRQRTEGGTNEGKGAEVVSRGSVVTVADSVISRATARRGKW